MWRVVRTSTGAAPRLRKHRPRATLAGSAAVAAAAIVAAVWMTTIRPTADAPGPLQTEAGSEVPFTIPAARGTVQRFADGSSLQLKPGTVLRLVENTASAVFFSLDNGRVRFNIRPGGPRKWRVQSGNATVTVLGTCFTVENEGRHTTVAVERGKVLVRNADAARDKILTAGESITIEETRNERATQPKITLPATTPNDAAPRETAEPTAQAQKNPDTRQAEWQIHAAAGDFKEAYAELGPEGVATLTRKTKSVDDLFQLADIARLSGHPSDAVAPLSTIVDDYPADNRAGLAAYTLAKLYLEPLSSPQEAFQTFDRAIALGLPSVLLEAACFKKAEALFQLNRPLGEEAAAAYLKRYPEGRYRKQLESRLNDAMTTNQ